MTLEGSGVLVGLLLVLAISAAVIGGLLYVITQVVAAPPPVTVAVLLTLVILVAIAASLVAELDTSKSLITIAATGVGALAGALTAVYSGIGARDGRSRTPPDEEGGDDALPPDVPKTG